MEVLTVVGEILVRWSLRHGHPPYAQCGVAGAERTPAQCASFLELPQCCKSHISGMHNYVEDTSLPGTGLSRFHSAQNAWEVRTPPTTLPQEAQHASHQGEGRLAGRVPTTYALKAAHHIRTHLAWIWFLRGGRSLECSPAHLRSLIADARLGRFGEAVRNHYGNPLTTFWKAKITLEDCSALPLTLTHALGKSSSELCHCDLSKTCSCACFEQNGSQNQCH